MRLSSLLFFTISALSASSLCAQIDLPPEEIDKYHTNLLLGKLNQQLSRIVPGKSQGLPKEEHCLIFFPEPMKDPVFRISANAYPIRIYLPHHFPEWAFRKNSILPFVHAHLTAKTGIREPLKDVWLSAAIIQELYEPGTIYGAAGYGNTPHARTMLAHGFFPKPEVILNSSMEDFYGQFSSAVRMEWASILLRQVWKKNGQFERHLVSGNHLSPARKFEMVFLENETAKKKKKVFSTPQKTLEQWFFTTASSTILSRGTPAAVPWIEESFRQIILSIKADLKLPDKKMKESEKVLSNESIRNLAQAEIKLNALAMKAPEQVALKLFRYAKAIREFRTNPLNPETLRLVFTEERAVCTALSERADLELVLKSAEQRLIPPGTRFALTLKAVSKEKSELPLLQKANQLMDHFEKDF